MEKLVGNLQANLKSSFKFSDEISEKVFETPQPRTRYLPGKAENKKT